MAVVVAVWPGDDLFGAAPRRGARARTDRAGVQWRRSPGERPDGVRARSRSRAASGWSGALTARPGAADIRDGDCSPRRVRPPHPDRGIAAPSATSSHVASPDGQRPRREPATKFAQAVRPPGPRRAGAARQYAGGGATAPANYPGCAPACERARTVPRSTRDGGASAAAPRRPPPPRSAGASSADASVARDGDGASPGRELVALRAVLLMRDGEDDAAADASARSAATNLRWSVGYDSISRGNPAGATTRPLTGALLCTLRDAWARARASGSEPEAWTLSARGPTPRAAGRVDQRARARRSNPRRAARSTTTRSWYELSRCWPATLATRVTGVHWQFDLAEASGRADATLAYCVA